MKIEVAFLTVALFSTHVQSSVFMRCDGYVEQNSDLRQGRKPASITIDLSLAEKTMEIEGWWGCLASIGQDDQSKSVPSGHKCLGLLPVSITDTAVTYSAQSDGPMYAGSTMFTLYRASGRLSAFSTASAKPAANARWMNDIETAEMQCVVAKKVF